MEVIIILVNLAKQYFIPCCYANEKNTCIQCLMFFFIVPNNQKSLPTSFFFVVEGMTPSRTGSDQKLCDTSESSDLDTRSGSISWSDYICVRCCQCSFWIKYCLFTINFFVWVSNGFFAINYTLTCEL